MSEKSNLLLRYEKMLRGECREWFDTEDYEEIALEYEMASMLSDALDVIETGLQCHPMSEELMTKKAHYKFKVCIILIYIFLSLLTKRSDRPILTAHLYSASADRQTATRPKGN